MENLFYKIQYKLTVKEINEYADSIDDKTNIDCKVCDWIDTFKCMYSSRAFDKPYYSTDFPYAVELTISEENGHVTAHAYDYEEYCKWQQECASVFNEWKQNADSDIPMPDIAEVRKDTGKLEVTDLKAASGLEAYKHFYRNYGDIAICG